MSTFSISPTSPGSRTSAGAPVGRGAHPYADKFPTLGEDDLAELAESIRANGLRQPIVLPLDGLILDGRNRYAACERAEVVSEAVVYDGDDLAEYVIDANVTRRNMSTGARAMATAMVLAADGRRREGRWDGVRSRALIRGSSSTNSEASWVKALSQCSIVLDFAPDLAPAVAAGDLTLDAAFRQAEDRRDAERRRLQEEERLAAEEADACAFIEETAPDLAAQVGDNGPFHSYVEARDVWNRRNREEAARLRREQEAAKHRAAEERRAPLRRLPSGRGRPVGGDGLLCGCQRDLAGAHLAVEAALHLVLRVGNRSGLHPQV